MAEFKVSISSLQSVKDQLNTLDEQLNKKREDLQSRTAQLSSVWEGEAHDSFVKAVNDDIAKINEFYTAVKDYVSKLDQITKKYEEAERKNNSLATERK